jgi:NAD(P)-dependent dehydrogenase (short-subunit alcohol dehydrogenase family)
VEQAVEIARGHGVQAFAFGADLADRTATTAAVERAAAALGGLDVVISNAGALSFGHFVEIDPRLPLPAFSPYAAAKHALRGFLATLAIEEREQGTGVRVAMVSPGPVATPVYRRATSATGHRPGALPAGHSPDVVAAALVRAVVHPRHHRLVGVVTRAGALVAEVSSPPRARARRGYGTGG